jgi:hypothetical protein
VVKQRCTIVCLFFVAISGAVTGFSQTLMMDTTKPAPTPPVRVAEPAVSTIAVRSGALGIVPSVHISASSSTNIPLSTIPSCCNQYTGTSGSGFSLLGEYALPLSSSLDLLIRASFQSASTTLTGTQPTTVRLQNTAIATEFMYTYNGKAGLFFVEPALELRLAQRLGVTAGLRVGAAVSATYDHAEKLGDPTLPYEFAEGSNERAATSGDIPDANALQLGLHVGLRYHIPIIASGTVELVPEASFAPMLTSMSSATDFYSISSLRFGLGIVYVLFSHDPTSTPLQPTR